MKEILALAAILALAPSPAPSQAAPTSTAPKPHDVQQASPDLPLRTEAALAAYLKANAGKPTPLDALSPLARRVFCKACGSARRERIDTPKNGMT